MAKVNVAAALNGAMILMELDSLAILTDEKKFLTRQSNWTKFEVNQARGIIDKVIFAAVDQLGVPRFDVPAELIAAAIHKFVHPHNWMAACSVFTKSASAENLEVGLVEVVQPSRLFALVLKIETEGKFDEQAIQKNASKADQGQG